MSYLSHCMPAMIVNLLHLTLFFFDIIYNWSRSTKTQICPQHFIDTFLGSHDVINHVTKDLCYKWSIKTNRTSSTILEILILKDFGVMTLIYCSHMMLSITWPYTVCYRWSTVPMSHMVAEILCDNTYPSALPPKMHWTPILCCRENTGYSTLNIWSISERPEASTIELSNATIGPQVSLLWCLKMHYGGQKLGPNRSGDNRILTLMNSI